MLIKDQIIRYGPGLYRVEYVSSCRALIVPITRRCAPGESPQGGISIAPNSCVDIIEDVERAKAEIELEAAEAELADARAELVKRAREEKSPPRVILPPLRGGWHATGTPTFKAGTLAAAVWAYILTNPGSSTSQVVAGVKSKSAVAACVSRFHQAHIIEKRG